MRKIVVFFILLNFNVFSQSIVRIPSPVDSRYNDFDRAMVPVIIKDNFLFCYTTKIVDAVERYQIVKVNLDTDETFLFESSKMPKPNTTFNATPYSFQFYKNDLYFISIAGLYKLDLLTGSVTFITNYCNGYHIFQNYLIYNYSQQTFVKNLISNKILEITAGNAIMMDATGFYEYNNQLYFRTYKNRINKFVPPNSVTNIYTAPASSDNVYSHNTIVKRINDNLVYLVLDKNVLKFISINLLTNAVNPNFSFNTLENHDLSVPVPNVLNNLIYLKNKDGVYTSNGIDAPVLTNLSFLPHYDGIVYNNQIFGVLFTNENGVELWKTDGTEAGTGMLKDINLGSGNINVYRSMMIHNNTLFFISDNAGGSNPGRFIYTSDGEENNTLPIISGNYFLSKTGQISNLLLGYKNNLYLYGETSNESGLFKIDIAPYVLNARNFDGIANNTSFYPNPTKDKVYTDVTMKNIQVYSLEGKLLGQVQNKNEISLTSLANGIYLIKYTNTKGEVTTQKIIKQ